MLARGLKQTTSPSPPGNGINTLFSLDPALGASIVGRLLPDGPVRQYDPADPSKLLLDRPSAIGIFEQWLKGQKLGHFPWHEVRGGARVLRVC